MSRRIEENNGKTPHPHIKRLGREFAMQYLFSCDMAGDDKLLFATFAEQTADQMEMTLDRYFRKGCAYAEQLIDGVRANLAQIDETIKKHSDNWDWERLSLVDCNVMRVAVYEMLFVADVPPIVSINEAVEIAMDFSGEKGGVYINGVLNGIKNSLTRPAREAVESL